MKKVVVIFLLFIYSATTIGATVHLHFCMDKFVGWDFNLNKEKKCGRCGMKESTTKKGCCKDETKKFKLDTDHQISVTDYYTSLISTPLLITQIDNYSFQIFPSDNLKERITRPPPNIAKQDLNVLYGNFRI